MRSLALFIQYCGGIPFRLQPQERATGNVEASARDVSRRSPTFHTEIVGRQILPIWRGEERSQEGIVRRLQRSRMPICTAGFELEDGFAKWRLETRQNPVQFLESGSVMRSLDPIRMIEAASPRGDDLGRPPRECGCRFEARNQIWALRLRPRRMTPGPILPGSSGARPIACRAGRRTRRAGWQPGSPASRSERGDACRNTRQR